MAPRKLQTGNKINTLLDLCDFVPGHILKLPAFQNQLKLVATEFNLSGDEINSYLVKRIARPASDPKNPDDRRGKYDRTDEVRQKIATSMAAKGEARRSLEAFVFAFEGSETVIIAGWPTVCELTKRPLGSLRAAISQSKARGAGRMVETSVDGESVVVTQLGRLVTEEEAQRSEAWLKARSSRVRGRRISK